MENLLLLLMLVAAIGIGWWLGRRESVQTRSSQRLLEAAAAGAGGLSLQDRSPSDLEALAASLRISPQTVETHLELGRLCRRRGEADKAIHIHQRLLDSAWLSGRWTVRAKFELARDYHSAGLLDRAEDLLVELSGQDDPELAGKAGELLLNLYEQERDWEHAIQVAGQLRRAGHKQQGALAAHYHCEIAAEALGASNYRRVERKLSQALKEDPASARALMLSAECACAQGQYAEACRHYRELVRRAPEFLPEVMDVLVDSFERADDETGLVALLRETLDQSGQTEALLLLAEMIRRDGDRDTAVRFLATHLRNQPSLEGLLRLVELNLSERGEAREQSALRLLQELLERMSAGKPAYLCGQCGFSGSQLHWHCPRCQGWGVIKPVSGKLASEVRAAE